MVEQRRQAEEDFERIASLLVDFWKLWPRQGKWVVGPSENIIRYFNKCPCSILLSFILARNLCSESLARYTRKWTPRSITFSCFSCQGSGRGSLIPQKRSNIYFSTLCASPITGLGIRLSAERKMRSNLRRDFFCKSDRHSTLGHLFLPPPEAILYIQVPEVDKSESLPKRSAKTMLSFHSLLEKRWTPLRYGRMKIPGKGKRRMRRLNWRQLPHAKEMRAS